MNEFNQFNRKISIEKGFYNILKNIGLLETTARCQKGGPLGVANLATLLLDLATFFPKKCLATNLGMSWTNLILLMRLTSNALWAKVLLSRRRHICLRISPVQWAAERSNTFIWGCALCHRRMKIDILLLLTWVIILRLNIAEITATVVIVCVWWQCVDYNSGF